MVKKPKKLKKGISKSGKSLVERLLDEFFGDSPLAVNFDDLSGITFDLPELSFSYKRRIHCHPFCLLVKKGREGRHACARNKFWANRKAVRERCGFFGMCHMGITDCVEPWIYRGRVLGVFYLGSVVRKEKESESRKRIDLRMARSGRGASHEAIAHYATIPRVDVREFGRGRKKILLVMELMSKIVAGSGILLDRYTTRSTTGEARARIEQSLLTQKAVHYIRTHLEEPLNLGVVAREIPCHPHTLCRTFGREMGMVFSDYIKRVRIERSCELLGQGKLSNGEISFQAGFQTQSHFNRIFKKIMRQTPSEYRESQEMASGIPR